MLVGDTPLLQISLQLIFLQLKQVGCQREGSRPRTDKSSGCFAVKQSRTEGQKLDEWGSSKASTPDTLGYGGESDKVINL